MVGSSPTQRASPPSVFFFFERAAGCWCSAALLMKTIRKNAIVQIYISDKFGFCTKILVITKIYYIKLKFTSSVCPNIFGVNDVS